MRTLVFLSLVLFATPGLAFGTMTDPTKHQKLHGVLKYLGANEERSYYDEIKLWDGTQTRKGFDTVLKYLDPQNILSHYANWDDNKIILFQDRDEKSVVDFSLAFQAGGAPTDPKGLIYRLRQIAQNSSERPLRGLRVALDPGHMGGRFWDNETGKFVAVNGRYVSEGILALNTCLLLGRELETLGAEVLITRYTAAPVSELPYDSFDQTPYIADEIRQSADKPWFLSLFNSMTYGPHLLQLFDQSNPIKRLHSGSKEVRKDLFITRADLRARAEKINTFKPHLSLIVHFDASKSNRVQNSANEIRTYVAGNMLADEFSSREQRYDAVRTLVDGHRWMESYVFSAAVVKNISDATKIKLMTSEQDLNAKKIVDGVYARNLGLNHLISEGAMTFLEVLNYDFEPEHRKLAAIDRHTTIETPSGPINIDYSSRLDDIVLGMRQGILEYVRSNNRY